ncbi:Ty3-gypsy retrotransposon protein [Abeliophyllum distichum]|uniref:Ty3-gypsy retrotransposon protein n=1 Tax=Abeliophyllum distichum TaxID=126358 RepID=A0ABD1QUS0_9LAMI
MFQWDNKCEQSFQELKQHLVTAPVLAVPEGSKGFVIYNVASKLGKANVVADAFSKKIVGQLTSVKDLERLQLEVLAPSSQVATRITSLIIQPTLRDRIREAQDNDHFVQKIKAEVGTDKYKDFSLNTDGALMVKGRICIPKDEKLRKEILEEAQPLTQHIQKERKCIMTFETPFGGIT